MTDHSERSEQEDQSQRDEHRQPEERYEERGGEAACWAHLVCPECGAMESEGHRPGCPAERSRLQPQEQADAAGETPADRQP